MSLLATLRALLQFGPRRDVVEPRVEHDHQEREDLRRQKDDFSRRLRIVEERQDLKRRQFDA